MTGSGGFRVRYFTALLLTLIMLTGSGCTLATIKKPPAVPNDLRIGLQQKKTALVLISKKIVISAENIQFYARSRDEGAVKGAGKGFLTGVKAGASAGATFALVVFIVKAMTYTSPGSIALAIPIGAAAGGAVGGALIGPVYGVANAPSAEYAKRVEKVLLERGNRALQQTNFTAWMQAELAERYQMGVYRVPLYNSELDEVLTDTETFKAMGYRYLFIPSIKSVEFNGEAGKDPVFSMKMAATVDIVDINQPENRYNREFTTQSMKFPSSDWIKKRDAEYASIFFNEAENLVEQIMYAIFGTAESE